MAALVCVAIVVLTVAVVAEVYSLEPQVWYNQATNYGYEQQNGNWVTYNSLTNSTSNGTFTDVFCQDTGSFSCKFTLTIELTGATFNQNSSNPLTSPQETELPISLHSGQSYSTRLYFSIDQNVTAFCISINVKPDQLFMRSLNNMWDSQNPCPTQNAPTPTTVMSQTLINGEKCHLTFMAC